MKKEERFTKILELLSSTDKLEVTELSEVLGVSQVTIRKDLDAMEKIGLIERIHGYAKRVQTDNIQGRLAWHYEEKKKIADKAIELVHDGDTVMIESGSCCALLASELTKQRKNVTIITNSAFIAEFIKDTSYQTILLGGIYQADSQCLVGPIVAQSASMFHVNYLFIGTDGYSDIYGFTNKDSMRAQVVRDLLPYTDKVAVLTESEKFNNVGTVSLQLKNKLDYLITDHGIPESIESQLSSENTTIIKA